MFSEKELFSAFRSCSFGQLTVTENFLRNKLACSLLKIFNSYVSGHSMLMVMTDLRLIKKGKDKKNKLTKKGRKYLFNFFFNKEHMIRYTERNKSLRDSLLLSISGNDDSSDLNCEGLLSGVARDLLMVMVGHHGIAEKSVMNLLKSCLAKRKGDKTVVLTSYGRNAVFNLFFDSSFS